MPRLTNKHPTYRHHKASGQAIVTISGQDRYLGPWQSKASIAAYDREIAEWLAAGRPSSPRAPEHTSTVSIVVSKFWKWAKAHYVKDGVPTGAANNFRSTLRLLKRLYGPIPAVEFGPLKLKALVALQVEQKKSRQFCNAMLGRIKQIFKFAVAEELLPPSVYQALATLDGLRAGHSKARECEPIEPVADKIVEKTLPHLPVVVRAMVQLQRLTGARPNEVCQIRPGDIDRKKNVWCYKPAKHKTQHHKKRRQIFIGPKAQAVLTPFLDREATAFCFSPSESKDIQKVARTAKRVTPANTGCKVGDKKKRWPKRASGERFTTATYRRAITRGCEVAFGMPKELRRARRNEQPDEKATRLVKAAKWRESHCWAPNQLRHAAATEIRERYDLEHAQVALGHAKANTAEIYAEKNAKLARNIAREIG